MGSVRLKPLTKIRVMATENTRATTNTATQVLGVRFS